MVTFLRGPLRLISRGPEPEEPPPPPSEYTYIDAAFTPVSRVKSHWNLPWRSYLETVSALDILDGLGMNFNPATGTGTTGWRSATARALREAGFTRARFEIGWNNISYADPTKLTSAALATVEANIAAFKENGLRPLILLNSNHGDPCPNVSTPLTLTTEAKVGDTQIHVNPAQLASIVKGKTGFGPNGQPKCLYLITNYTEDGTCTLSQPLKEARPVGPIVNSGATASWTLLYTPFQAPLEADGVTPNPSFEATMLGWLKYEEVVVKKVKELLGSEEFDIEIWNEFTFGANFRNINNYYEPDFDSGAGSGSRDQIIFTRSCAWLRDPANGVQNVGIDNGFVNQNNERIGAPGATANSRHPYPGKRDFPASESGFEAGSAPVDASGQVAATKVGSEYVPLFTPTYRCFLPEYYLHQIQVESHIFDIGPWSIFYTGANAGRDQPAPVKTPLDVAGGMAPSGYLGKGLGDSVEMWFTETNTGEEAKWTPGITIEDRQHIKSKVLLRTYIPWLTKGLRAIYLYASGEGKKEGDLQTISKSFFDTIKADPAHAYPGLAAAGEAMLAMQRFTQALAGATSLAKERDVTLDGLIDYAGNIQFKGSEAFPGYDFPDLTNKDCFFFQPIQVNEGKLVVPVYVMTRDITHEYSGTGPTRFDLPEEKYRLTIGGVKGTGAVVSVLDPITGASIPLTIVEATGSKLVVELKVTDYPRLITIQEAS
jgi:hypothetical protein